MGVVSLGHTASKYFRYMTPHSSWLSKWDHVSYCKNYEVMNGGIVGGRKSINQEKYAAYISNPFS